MIIDCIANTHLGAAVRGHFGDLGQFAAGHTLEPLGAAGVILEIREGVILGHFSSYQKTLMLILC